jgi:hypothetical protein
MLSYKAYSPEDFSSYKYKEIKKHLSSSKVSAIISRDMCAVRYLNLPATDTNEIRHMLELQKPKLFPFKYRQATVKPIINGTDDEGNSRVMVAVVPNSALYEKLNILNNAGIHPSSLYLSSSILFERFKEKFSQTDIYNMNCLIVNIENNSLDIIISKKTGLVFTYGCQLLDDRQQACSKVISDLQRAISIFKKDHQQEIDRIIVNSSSYTANLLSIIESRMHIKSIVSNALELMEAASQINSKKNHLLNIMPNDILKTNLAHRIKKHVLVPAVSVVILMVFLLSGFYFYISRNRVDIKNHPKSANLLIQEAEASLSGDNKPRDAAEVTIDAYVEPKIAPVSAEKFELIGVLLTKNKKQALIKDVKKNEVYKCSPEDNILGVTVKEIEFNKVIISSDSKDIELRM